MAARKPKPFEETRGQLGHDEPEDRGPGPDEARVLQSDFLEPDEVRKTNHAVMAARDARSNREG